MTDHLLSDRPGPFATPSGSAPGYPAPLTRHDAGASGDGGAQALLSAALITALLVIESGITVARWNGWLPQHRLAGEVIADLPLVLLGVIVALRGRTPVRRLLSAGVVALTLAVSVGYSHLILPRLFRYSVQDPDLSLLRVVTTGYSAIFVALVVTAWGICRRRHAGWAIGVVVGIALATALSWFQVGNLIRFGDTQGARTLLMVSTNLLWHAAPLVGGLVGWLVDRVLGTSQR